MEPLDPAAWNAGCLDVHWYARTDGPLTLAEHDDRAAVVASLNSNPLVAALPTPTLN